MSRGPFSAKDVGGEISPLQQQGGFTPTNPDAVVEAVGQAAQQIGGVVAQRKAEQVQEEVTEKTRSVQLALTAQVFPQFADELLAEEAQANPVVKGAMGEMAKIKGAIEQGVLPTTYALNQLTAIQQNAINAAPEFADEIRAAVRDVTGRDPQQAFFGTLLSQSGAKRQLSPAEKAQQEVELEVQTLVAKGLSEQAARQQVALGAQLEFDKTMAAAQASQNIELTQNLEKVAVNAAHQITRGITNQLTDMIAQGGTIDPNLLLLQLNSQIDEAQLALTNSLPPGVPLSEAQTAMTTMNNLRSRLTPLIENGDMATLLQNDLDIVTRGAELGLMQDPDFLLAAAISKRNMVPAIELLERARKGGERGKAVNEALSPLLKLLGNADGARKYMTTFQRIVAPDVVGPAAQPPQSTEEKNIHAAAAHSALKTGDIEVQARALQEMMAVHGEKFTFTALESKEVFLSLDPQAHGATLEGLQIDQTQDLTKQFFALLSNPAIDVNKFKLEGNQLTYATDPFDRTQGGYIRQGFESIQPFIEQYNTVSRVSLMYTNGGKMNKSLYPSAAGFWDKVTKPAHEAMEQQAEQDAAVNTNPSSAVSGTGVVVWEDDENGIPRPVRR